MNPNPVAYFDVLVIVDRLQRRVEMVSSQEVHLFAYLACLLFLYRGNATSDWGYVLASTTDGYPFAADLDMAFELLAKTGMLSATDSASAYVRITDLGREEMETLSSLSQNRARLPYLDGACGAALALPMRTVKDALLHDPELGKAAQLSASKILFDGPGMEALHEHFSALSDGLGLTVGDLTIPAVVWLSFIEQSTGALRRAEEEEPHASN